MITSCTFENCGRTVHAHELCSGHAKQARRGQSLRPLQYRVPRHLDVFGRLAARVDVAGADDCWHWTGGRRADGYGIMFDPRTGNGEYVHRLAYEHTSGEPIPAGMQIDHLCRNRSCCNPSHLELVTHEENARRALLDRGLTAEESNRLVARS